MTPHQKPVSQAALNPSWMLTFGDLLGIILATFVLIYATSDRQTPELREMIAELSAGLFVEATQDTKVVVTDIMSPVGYQKALLQKQLDSMPYWSIQDAGNGDVILSLKGRSLSAALHEGVWLDVIERFERPVSLVIEVPETAEVTTHLSGIAAIKNLRSARGLSAAWRFAVQAGPELQTQIIIHHPDRDAPLRFFAEDDALKAASAVADGDA